MAASRRIRTESDRARHDGGVDGHSVGWFERFSSSIPKEVQTMSGHAPIGGRCCVPRLTFSTLKNWRDTDGNVFRGYDVIDAEPGWSELTAKEWESVEADDAS